MGRYYSLSNGMGGKFGFGVQASDDPTIFGMTEEEPTNVNYYLEATKANIAKVKRVLDEQYDILEYPREKRVYSVQTEEDLRSILPDLDDYVFYACLGTEKPDEMPYASDPAWMERFRPEGVSQEEYREKWKIIPKSHERILASCRIWLGIKILSCLEAQGECSLEAEL